VEFSFKPTYSGRPIPDAGDGQQTLKSRSAFAVMKGRYLRNSVEKLPNLNVVMVKYAHII
jgi:hypothetical protein